MTNKNNFHKGLFEGLKALAESTFPKRCGNCGRIFETAQQFLSETSDITTSRSGLKGFEDDDGAFVVEVFRNCPCGSTLMDFFGDRRDNTEAGNRRRKRFEELLDFLDKNGLDRNIARTELKNVMCGERSELLDKLSPPK